MTHRAVNAACRLVCIGATVVVCIGVCAGTSYGDASAGDGGGTISVGVATGSSAAGSGGVSATGTDASGPAACTYLLLSPADQTLLGVGGQQPGSWYVRECPNESANSLGSVVVWVTDQGTSGAAPTSPLSIAEQAERSMTLPRPIPEVNPSPRGVVNFPEWLWVDPSMWHAVSVTASAGGVSATATAAPISVTWSMGDGSVVVCDGPGTPYSTQLPASAQTTSCSFTYRQSSAGQASADGNPNDAAFAVTATVTWRVTWQADGAPGGGSLPDLTTSDQFPLPVQQIESVNVR